MGPVPFDTSCFCPPINRPIYRDGKSAGKSADLSASGAAALYSIDFRGERLNITNKTSSDQNEFHVYGEIKIIKIIISDYLH